MFTVRRRPIVHASWTKIPAVLPSATPTWSAPCLGLMVLLDTE